VYFLHTSHSQTHFRPPPCLHPRWQQLQPELLCQALSDDSDAALRRAARAVCRDWRAVVDTKAITQLCCDITELHRIGRICGLRHVVVEGAADRMRGRQHLQQRLWANARLSKDGFSQQLPAVEPLPAPRGDLSPLAALPGVQAVTLRCLPLLTANFQQQAAHLTHLTSLTLQQPYGDIIPRMMGVREALSALPKLKALTLIHPSRYLAQQVLLGEGCTSGPPGPTDAAAGPSRAAPDAANAAAPSSVTPGTTSVAGRSGAGPSTADAAGRSRALPGANRAEGDDDAPPSTSGAAGHSSVPTASALPCPWLAGLQSLAVRSGVGLPDLKPALASLTSCTHLDLSNCDLNHRVPPCLGQLTQLQVSSR
jgi:hypothetical protein